MSSPPPPGPGPPPPPSALTPEEREKRRLQREEKERTQQYFDDNKVADPLTVLSPFGGPSMSGLSDSEQGARRRLWDKSFEKTFNQFWGEACKYVDRPVSAKEKMAGTSAHAVQQNRNQQVNRLKEIAEECFLDAVEDTNKTTIYLKNESKARHLTAPEKKKILQDLLEIGYLKFDLEYVTDGEVIEVIDFDLSLYGDRLERKPQICFRCDGRKPSEIEQHRGTKCRADVEALSKAKGFNEPWHPFSDAANRNVMWFRKGSADNDLDTVISLSPEFEAACGFPMIDDAQLKMPTEPEFQGAGGFDQAKWDAHFQPAQAKCKNQGVDLHTADLVTPGAARELKFAIRSFVYVILIDDRDRHARTQKLQSFYQTDEFPEFGVRSVKWTHHLAMIPVRKLYLANFKSRGYYLFFEEVQVLQPKPVLQRLLGLCATPDRVKRMVEQVLRKANRAQQSAPPLGNKTVAWPAAWGPI